MLNILKLLLGLKIEPKSGVSQADSAGELEVLSSDNKIRYHNGVSSSPVVTEAHTATLTNKTIDANGTGNSISNLETADLAAGVLKTDVTMASATDTEIPSALAIKTYVDNQILTEDSAAEISFTPVGNIVATNVQTMGQELDADLSTEITARSNADTTLQTNINTEASTRATADTTLQTNIDNHINDAVDAHDASAVSYDPSASPSGMSVTTVQEAVNTLDEDITDHIVDTTGAHVASAIANTPSGNLAATNIQTAVNELQTDIDTTNTNLATEVTNRTNADTTLQTNINAKITGPASSTDERLVRFDGTTGKLAQDSAVTLSDAGVMSGLAGISSSGTASFSGTLASTGTSVITGTSQEGTTSESATTGANALVPGASLTNPIVRLTNASLVSIGGINATDSGRSITLINDTGVDVQILNQDRVDGFEINTGTGGDVTFKDGSAWLFKYNQPSSHWNVIGGTGAGEGGSASLDTIFQLTGTELLATWSTGDNATFLGGGTLSGTFDYNTSTPLSGEQSYRYTQAAGSLNDYLASPAQDVALRFRGQDVTLFFPYKYDGATNDIEVVFYDVTNAAIIPSSTYLSNSPTVSIFKSNIVIPTTCASIRVGFQTDVLNSGKILEFADVQLTSDTTVYADIDNDLQSSFLFVAGTVTNATVSGAATRTSGSGIFSYNSATGVYTMLKRGKVTVSYGGLYAATSCTPTIRRNSVGVANSVQASGGLTTTTAYTEVLDVGVTFDCYASGGISNNYVSVSAQAGNAYILTAPETFSSDTAAFTYAGSATYTLATLANAPVGTYITFAYATSTNTRTQTTGSGAGNLRPTQTDSSMNTNGILIYPRAYNAASTGELPAAIAIQIGKGLKGKSLDLYKSTGKTTAGSLDFWGASTTAFSTGAAFKDYNESTGILLVDAGYQYNTAVTTANFQFSDLTTQTSGYLVINASKNPALTGMNVNRVAARGVSTSGQSFGAAFTTMTYDAVKTFDTHGALVAATGVFTAPESGYYQINNLAYFIDDSHTVSNQALSAIFKNGVEYSRGSTSTASTGTYRHTVRISDVIYLSKGDTADIRIYNDDVTTLNTNATYNWTSIIKIGN